MAIETLGGLISLLATLFIILIIFAVVCYIYFALTLMITAKRLRVKNAWLAWIPLVNIYLYPKMAEKPVWPIIFILIPSIFSYLFKIIGEEILILTYVLGAIAIIGIVFGIIWFIEILKRRGKPWWWILLILIPIFGIVWLFIMWGILAWGKDKEGIKSPLNKNNPPNRELVEYLKKYRAEGYTIEELREHLINEGQNPQKIDEAIKYLQ